MQEEALDFSDNDAITRAVIGTKLIVTLGTPVRAAAPTVKDLGQPLAAGAQPGAQSPGAKPVAKPPVAPVPRQTPVGASTQPPWRWIGLGAAVASGIAILVVGSFLAGQGQDRAPAPGRAGTQPVPIDPAGPTVTVVDKAYPAAAGATPGIPIDASPPQGVVEAPQAREREVDANAPVTAARPLPGADEPSAKTASPTPQVGAPMPSPIPLPPGVASNLPRAATLPPGAPPAAAAPAAQAQAPSAPASRAAALAQGAVIIDESVKGAAPANGKATTAVIELAKPAPAPAAPPAAARAPTTNQASSAPAAAQRTAPAVAQAPPAASTQAASAAPAVVLRPTPPVAQATAPAAAPASAPPRMATPAVDRPATPATPVPTTRVTIVDIAPDGQTVLVTNPTTRLPMRLSVGQALPTGEVITTIDVQAGEIRAGGKIYRME